MICETNSLTTIGVGAQRAQTEAGDTALRIPNLILPTIALMEPTQLAPSNTDVSEKSLVRNSFSSRNNQVGATITLATLAKGLWDITLNYALKFSYAAPIAFNTNENTILLVSPLGGISSILLNQFPVQAGELYKSASFRVLLFSSGQINYTVGATGAADFLDANVTIIANKLL